MNPVISFSDRHLGSSAEDIQTMLETLGLSSLEALGKEAVPTKIQHPHPLSLPEAQSEENVLSELKTNENATVGL